MKKPLTVKHKCKRLFQRVVSDIKYTRIFGLRYVFYTRQRKRNKRQKYRSKLKYGNNFLNSKPALREVLAKRDGIFCADCRQESENLTIDHIVKRSEGGSNKLKNLQLLCRNCHDGKDNPQR